MRMNPATEKVASTRKQYRVRFSTTGGPATSIPGVIKNGLPRAIKVRDSWRGRAWIEVRDGEEAPWVRLPDQDRAIEQLQWQANLDRYITPHWGNKFQCNLCGALVVNQVQHFRFHQQVTRSDPAYLETIQILFGGQ